MSKQGGTTIDVAAEQRNLVAELDRAKREHAEALRAYRAFREREVLLAQGQRLDSDGPSRAKNAQRCSSTTWPLLPNACVI